MSGGLFYISGNAGIVLACFTECALIVEFAYEPLALSGFNIANLRTAAIVV